MAKKFTNPVTSSATKKPVVGSFSTPVRNSPIPRVQTTPSTQAGRKLPPTPDQIAVRAYEIWLSGKGGNQDDHWYQAVRELGGK